MCLTKWSGWMLLGVMLLTFTAQAAETRDPNRYFFDQSFGNLQDEVAEARKEQKIGILVMFETADCPWCEKMMSTVLNQASVQDYYRQYFRAIQVDTNGDLPLVNFSGREMTQKEFAFGHNRVRATPVFAFFDLQGDLMTKYTGATKDANEFLWLGEFVVTGAYKNGNFTVYKRGRQAAEKK